VVDGPSGSQRWYQRSNLASAAALIIALPEKRMGSEGKARGISMAAGAGKHLQRTHASRQVGRDIKRRGCGIRNGVSRCAAVP